MKLSEFVSDTLVEIMNGVVSAQAQWTESGQKGHINPVWGGYEAGHKNIREVQFDVAVTVTEAASGGTKGGIKVLSLGEIGAEGQKSHSNSQVSRIAFTVPIAPPIIFIEEPKMSGVDPDLMPKPIL